MQQLPSFPPEVHRYISAVFRQANRRTAEKIARVPNCSEPSVDLTLIESLTQYAGPRVVAPGWAVRLDVHYLGGLRHFYKWEIADIGILVFAKQRGAVVAKKVALLQSKRLYPDAGDIIEETEEDYRIGFGNLLPGAPVTPSIALSHTFRFTPQSRYKALISGDHQYKAIEQYEANLKLPVHYLFYNPWRVPCTYHYPVSARVKLGQKGNGGCRVVPAKTLRSALANQSANYRPSFADLAGLVSRGVTHAHGWRLEHFVANLVMKCQEGATFQSLDEENMYSLFNRRSGPIAAAMAVTIENYSE
jgi:hypothetical protein